MYGKIIKWFAHNPVAANLLMVGILISGFLSIRTSIPLEVFPPFRFDAIQVSTYMPGATPEDVEKGVTSIIEDAIHDIEGIKELSSRSSQALSSITATLASGHDKQTLLENIKRRVDGINTLPENAEKPEIQAAEFLLEVMNVVISGNYSRKEMLPIVESIRDELLQLDGVSQVNFLDRPGVEISIEISPTTLEKYQLNMQAISSRINNHLVDINAGNLKTPSGNFLVRTKQQDYSIADFAAVPIITDPNGTLILLGDIANISEDFEEIELDTLFNGKPSMSLQVFRQGTESAVSSAKAVREFIANKQKDLPVGVELNYWRDSSVIVESRLSTLLNSAIQGGLLVMILLSLFLRPAVAFWVCLGIPVCFMGAIALMPMMGVTFNMISLFGFILVLGIVVDDAIVTGENIFRHLRQGKTSLDAAIQGTEEVAVPVTFGVLTTVVAFTPLLMIEGSTGDIFKNIPLITIPVLLFSLVESKLILPAHMRHVKTRKISENTSRFNRWQQGFSLGFEKAILTVYQPLLRICLRNKLITLFSALVFSAAVFTALQTGWLKFIFFPDVDDEAVIATITMPSTAGFYETNRQVEHLVNTAKELQEEYRNPETGESVIEYIISFAGVTLEGQLKSNSGLVAFEVQAPEIRGDIPTSSLADEWREKIGIIPGAEQLSIQSKIADPGRPIAFQLRGDNNQDMDIIASRLKDFWQKFPSLFDIQDSQSDVKEEVKIVMNKDALALGLTESSVASQLRNNIFGLDVQKFVRGRNEITVKLRYPAKHRASIDDLQSLPIQLPNKTSVPLQQVASIETIASPTAINHYNRLRTMTVSADLDKKTADIEAIKNESIDFLDAQMSQFPGISYSLEGEAKQQQEAFGSLSLGIAAVLLAIYALLAIPFKSYWQPLIVMSVIPLGFVGAILGHIIMGTSLSLLSFMGMLALTGVVVNDSLVLVDYINQQRKRGAELFQAVLTAGTARFRPVMLTSLTTFAGLTPILAEKSTQAQFLKPMAISLAFGILFATLITLIIVPLNYILFHKTGDLIKRSSRLIFLQKQS